MAKQLMIYALILLLFINGSILAKSHKERGIEYLQEEQYDNAIQALRQAVLADANDAEALFYLGVAYRKLGSGQLRNALSGIRHALEINSSDPAWHYELALVYDDMDQYRIELENSARTTYELAVEKYENTIERDRNFIKAHLSLGMLYQRKGKCELASKKYDDVTKLDIRNVVAYLNWADCLCMLGQHEDAIEKLNQVEKLEPHNINPFFKRGNICYGLKKYELALKEFEAVLQRDPSNKRARELRDLCQKQSDETQAIEELIRAGDTSVQNGRFEQAIGQYEQVLKIVPNHQDALDKIRETKIRLSKKWFREGKKFVDKGRLEQAVGAFNKALEYAQTKAQLDEIVTDWQSTQLELGERAKMYKVRRKGEQLYIEKEFSKARSYFEVITQETHGRDADLTKKLTESKIQASFKFAEEKELNGELMAALVFYQETFKLDTTNTIIKFKIEKLKGDLALEREDWDKAIQHYESAMTIKPEEDPKIVDKIRQAKASKYTSLKWISYAGFFVFCILIGGYVFTKKRSKQKTGEQDTTTIDQTTTPTGPVVPTKKGINTFFILVSLFILIVLLITLILIKDKAINAEQSALLFSTVFIITIGIVFSFKHKLTNVTFKIKSKFVRFTLGKNEESDHNQELINERIGCSEFALNNFNEISLLVKKIKIGEQEFENCEFEIQSKRGTDNLIKFFPSENSNLTIESFQIASASEVQLKKDNDNLVFELSKMHNFEKNKESELILNTEGLINIEVEGVKIFVNNEGINYTHQCCSIELGEKTTVYIKNFQDKILEFTVKMFPLGKDRIQEICNLNNVQNISFRANESEESEVIDGIIMIDQIEKKLNRRATFLVEPNQFDKLEIQAHSRQFSLDFFGDYKSLKIGRHDLASQNEEIPNLALWMYNNQVFKIILVIFAWIGFLGAMKEAGLIEAIMKLIK